jgi:hypothetical protein
MLVANLLVTCRCTAVCCCCAPQGYAVVDGVFGPISSHRLQLELLHVHQSGLMHLNHTHLVTKGETKLLAKSQVLPPIVLIKTVPACYLHAT